MISFDALKTLIVGKSEQDAAKSLKDLTMSLRVVIRDGVSLGCTPDVMQGRVNVAITKGIVDRIHSLG